MSMQELILTCFLLEKSVWYHQIMKTDQILQRGIYVPQKSTLE